MIQGHSRWGIVGDPTLTFPPLVEVSDDIDEA